MSAAAALALPAAPRILVRGVNWLGDAVMTTPALLRLREHFPAAHITLLTAGKIGALWQHHPAVNEVISFAAEDSVFAVGKKLRAGHFDLALVLPNSPRSALEPFLARIPQRIGYARPWRNLLLTQAIPSRPGAVKMHKRTPAEVRQLIAVTPPVPVTPPPPAAHQIYEYLHLVAALGANPEPVPPRLEVTPAELEAARQKFGLTNSPGLVLGLNPGAEYGPAKRWPADKFAAAAKAIQQRTGCTWLIFGGKNDLPLATQIQSALGPASAAALNVAGQTSLRELMALLRLCQVLLTNDTGPMHVAAALGTPVVVPFGSTSPELTGPGLPGDPRHRLLRSAVPCAPCFLRECPIDFRCLNGITVESVVQVVVEILRQTP
ncbi:MAG TPA: lipopolysaccharide heptosyltransferase II [Dongiaceae bacterium]|nr:lipopolysaccharide heptosyltransferase II [Dongiaceae bacterium]